MEEVTGTQKSKHAVTFNNLRNWSLARRIINRDDILPSKPKARLLWPFLAYGSLPAAPHIIGILRINWTPNNFSSPFRSQNSRQVLTACSVQLMRGGRQEAEPATSACRRLMTKQGKAKYAETYLHFPIAKQNCLLKDCKRTRQALWMSHSLSSNIDIAKKRNKRSPQR